MPTAAELSLEIVETLAKGRLAVFCGAGISVGAGVPTVQTIIDSILTCLPLNDADKALILEGRLPFEAFVEAISECADIQPLMAMFNCGQPHASHCLLAKWARLGLLRTICTTNFDKHIETAFDNEGLIRHIDYVILWRTEQFRTFDWSDHRVAIIKIHGSIDDMESIAITLHDVAARRFVHDRQAIIKKLFADGDHTHVLILGYSCSDHFDISPAIAAISDNQKYILLIQHCHDMGEGDGEILTSPLGFERGGNHPFRRWSQGLRWHCDTDKLLKYLWLRTVEGVPSDWPEKATSVPSCKVIIEQWWNNATRNTSVPIAHLISAELIQRIGYPKLSAQVLRQALALAKERDDRKTECLVLGSLGICYSDTGDYDCAIQFHSEALRAARSLGDKTGESCGLGSMGVAYVKSGQYKMGVPLFEQALSVAHELGDPYLVLRWLCNIGSVATLIGDYSRGLDASRRALTLAVEIGDKATEIDCHQDIGNAYLRLGSYEAARVQYEDGLRVAKEIGSDLLMVKALSNLGGLHAQLEEYELAVQLLMEGVDLSQKVEDKYGEAVILGQLGIICMKLGIRNDAEEFFGGALEIDSAIGNEHGKAEGFFRLAESLAASNEYETAHTTYLKSLGMFQALNDRHGTGKVLGGLGLLLREQGRTVEAVQAFEAGISMARQIGDRFGECIRLGNLAALRLDNGEYKDAALIASEAKSIAELLFPNGHELRKFTERVLEEAEAKNSS